MVCAVDGGGASGFGHGGEKILVFFSDPCCALGGIQDAGDGILAPILVFALIRLLGERRGLCAAARRHSRTPPVLVLRSLPLGQR